MLFRSAKGKNEINVTATVARNGYMFKCEITDANGVKVTSTEATLTVDEAAVAAGVEVTQAADNGGKFMLKASAAEGCTYLWKYSRDGGNTWYYWQNPGKDAHTMTGAATASRNGYQFRCQITDAFGNVDFTDVYVLNGDVINPA